MITLAIANQKGGVGKTTTAVTLAHGLALKGYTVLLVDLDPQGQCASHLGLEQESGVFNLLLADRPLRDVVRSTRRDNLYLLPGNKRTATAESLLAIERRPITHLAEVLGTSVNGSRLHYLLLDTAPSVGGLQENALYACDVLIVPAAVDYLSLEGVAMVLETLKAIGRPAPPLTYILPTFFDEVTRESRANLTRLEEAFGAMLLPAIHRAAALRECPALGRTIFEHDPDSRAAAEYAQVVWEVLDATTQR